MSEDRIWLRTPSGVELMYTLPLDEYIDRQWRDGTLTRINEDGSAYLDDPFTALSAAGEPTAASGEPAAEEIPETSPAEDTPAEPVRPAPNAPKGEWVAFAEALGLDPAGKTKAQLVELTTPPEMQPPEV